MPRVIVRPLQEFLRSSTAGAVPLLIAVGVALVAANSPWWRSFAQVWDTPVVLRVGRWAIAEDVRFWINEGLMTFFFLLAGLEIKRELTTGELRQRGAAVLAVASAVAGMIVPALLFLAFTHGTSAAGGWGMAMPTDLAFALGILVLAARVLPAGVRPFVLTLAIVDDLLTVIVVGLFYAQDLSAAPVLGALVCIGAMLALERAHVRSLLPYLVLGVGVWIAAYAAGIHPALAGAVLGILAPARPFHRPAAVSSAARRIADQTADDPEPPDADAAQWLELSRLSGEAVSPLARIEHALLPWVNLFVLPAFALANAGVRFTSAAWAGRTAQLLIVGLVFARAFGKGLGVFGGAWLVRRLGVGRFSTAIPRRVLAGAAVATGAPFTVSLFVASTAFAGDPGLLAAARLGVLLSLGACAVATVLLLRGQSGAQPG